MPRVAAVLLAVATACACLGSGEGRAVSAVDAATAALRRGETVEAESQVARGLALVKSRPDSAVAWRLRLLRADVALAKRELPEAVDVSRAAVPEEPAFKEIRARQKFLQARLAYGQGKLADALPLANDARQMADAASELNLEVGAFAGQLAMQLGRWGEGEALLDTVVTSASQSGHRYVEAMARNAYGMGKFVRSRCDEALPSFEHI